MGVVISRFTDIIQVQTKELANIDDCKVYIVANKNKTLELWTLGENFSNTKMGHKNGGW
jgi:predicted nucleic acid-binding protein